jgi:hypothetical protein
MKSILRLLVIISSFISICGYANTSMHKELTSISPQIVTWAQQSIIQADLAKANNQHANYTKSQFLALNKQWQNELKASNKPTIKKVLNNSLSTLLDTIKDHSKGLYQSIVITDKYGLNIGQSDVTENYYQANQKLWKKAYSASQIKPYILLGSQKKGHVAPAIIAMPILDAEGKVAGVVVVEIDKAKLASISQS